MYPYYGAHWLTAGVTINTVKSDIISIGTFTITPNGKNNYNRLRLADKMIVTNEYAEYVISKVSELNNIYASTDITD